MAVEHIKSLVLTTVTLSPLLAFGLPTDSVIFGPEAGSKLTKTFAFAMELELVEQNTILNGEESPTSMEMKSTSRQEIKVVVTDEYMNLRDDAPIEFRRSFDELEFEEATRLSLERMGEEKVGDLHASGISALEGKTVVFSWDDDNEGYTKGFEQGGDEDLLKGLAEDMDLRVFLPEDEVQEGDKWKIEPNGLIDILFPGGDFAFTMESDGDEPPMPAMDPKNSPYPREWFTGQIEGDLTAKYVGTCEVDDIKVAVIEITVKIIAARDMTDFLSRTILDEEAPEGMSMSVDHMAVDTTLDGTGRLLWDLGGGHLHTLELRAKVERFSDSAVLLDIGGEALKVEETSEHSGIIKVFASVE